MAKYKFIADQLRATIREACSVAKNGHRETCGLLVDNGYFLEIVPVRNRARRPGRFILDGPQTRALERAIRRLNRTIVGTYHAHPVSTATPGTGDIAGAFEGDLMLVIDCIERHAKLWRIEKNKARALLFDSAQLTNEARRA